MLGFAQLLFAETPDVYVVADTCHIDPGIRRYTADLLKRLRQTNSQIDCIFVEWDSGGNSNIKDYLDNKRSFDDAINGERKRIWSLTGNGTMPMLDPSLLDAARDEKVGEGHVNVYAVDPELGSKIRREADQAADKFEFYSYDHKYGGNTNPYDRAPKEVIENMVAKQIVARSGGMADIINQHFINGDCHGGILVIGAAHTEPSDHGFPSTPTVQEFLEAKNRSVQLIHPGIHDICVPR